MFPSNFNQSLGRGGVFLLITLATAIAHRRQADNSPASYRMPIRRPNCRLTACNLGGPPPFPRRQSSGVSFCLSAKGRQRFSLSIITLPSPMPSSHFETSRSHLPWSLFTRQKFECFPSEITTNILVISSRFHQRTIPPPICYSHALSSVALLFTVFPTLITAIRPFYSLFELYVCLWLVLISLESP